MVRRISSVTLRMEAKTVISLFDNFGLFRTAPATILAVSRIRMARSSASPFMASCRRSATFNFMIFWNAGVRFSDSSKFLSSSSVMTGGAASPSGGGASPSGGAASRGASPAGACVAAGRILISSLPMKSRSSSASRRRLSGDS